MCPSVEATSDELHLLICKLASLTLQNLYTQCHVLRVPCSIQWNDAFLNAELVEDLLRCQLKPLCWASDGFMLEYVRV